MKITPSFRNVLCIRLDNMGDVLMSEPAIRALRETFNSRITLLTSTMGCGIAPCLSCIDDVIIYDAPWVRKGHSAQPSDLCEIVRDISLRDFDAAVNFSVFSQNPIGVALIMFLSGIPVRAGYCRENPYELLTHWLPDPEPYRYVKHQVERDLALSRSLGARLSNDSIRLYLDPVARSSARRKITDLGGNPVNPWILLHPGASESRRQYPVERWIEIGQMLAGHGHQLLITGGVNDRQLVKKIVSGVGRNVVACAGILDMPELTAVVKDSALLISVNTVTAHIAAATQTPSFILYALTNPQHLPWKAPGRLFPFSVPEEQISKNEVLRFVRREFFPDLMPFPDPAEIAQAAFELLSSREFSTFPKIITPEWIENYGKKKILNFQEP